MPGGGGGGCACAVAIVRTKAQAAAERNLFIVIVSCGSKPTQEDMTLFTLRSCGRFLLSNDHGVST